MLPYSIVLLDGGIGTELDRRGVDMREVLDQSDEHDTYWSGKALLTAQATVRQIHEEYLRAGADIITTNTFRVNGLVLRKLGVREPAAALIGTAIRLAQAARAEVAPRARVGVSIGPLESWNAPERAPSEAVLIHEHHATIAAAVAAGVDIALPETMNSSLEASIVAREAAAAGVPFVIGFCLRADGSLPGGESLSSAVAAVLDFKPLGVLVNHSEPTVVDVALPALGKLLDGTGVSFGARPHLPRARPGARENGGQSVSAYVRHVRRWLDTGASLIGGCCGTGPAHIDAVDNLRTNRMA